jgi:hypothetical protein
MVAGMSHEPLTFIELLQGQLTAQDRRILFLFGAGSSCSVNVAPAPARGEKATYKALIPAVRELTEMCKTEVVGLGMKQSEAWKTVEQVCADGGRPAHIENLLSLIRLNIEANPSSGALGLTADELSDVHARILETIAKVVKPDDADIPGNIAHDRFAHWVKGARRKHPLEVFTTNYDVLLERSLEAARVPVFDGFIGSYRPFFMPQLAASAAPWQDAHWTGLWKLHGSVNWDEVDNTTIRTENSNAGSMIYPSHLKYDESRRMPYVALITRLANTMAMDSAVLVTVGYSWNDEHINACIVEALEEHHASGAIALMYEELDQVPHLTKLAQRLPNLLVAGPRSAVLGGRVGDWEMSEPAGRTKATLLDAWFDSDGVPPDKPDGTPVGGQLRLGDFNYFASFVAGLNTTPPWVH